MNKLRNILIIIATLMLVTPALAATTASVMHNPKFLAIDVDGNPYAGCKLHTFKTTTTTPKATWDDATKISANLNPVILDINGEADVWIDSSDGAYTFRLDDADDVPIWTVNDIEAINGQTITDAIAAASLQDALGINYCYPDAAEADQGVLVGGLATIKDCVDDIGLVEQATIVLRRGSAGATTIYTLTTNETITDNITLEIEHGAIIDGAGTCTIDGPFEAGLSQVFSGAGSVSFGDGSVKEVYPEWWGAAGDGVTDDVDAINSAIASTDEWVKFATGKTYIVTLNAIGGDYWDYRVGPLKDNMNLIGYGATIKLKDGESPDILPKRYQWFYGMEADPAIENVNWRGLTFDGNGANNYSYGLVATDYYNNAFFFTWQGVTNLSIKDCTFKNNPGGNEIYIYDDNSVAGLVSENITISDNFFYENGLDTWDHTSIWAAGTNVIVDNNIFYQAIIRQDLAVASNLAMEIHGDWHSFTNNQVYNYREGCLVGGSNAIVSDNIFHTLQGGITVWRGLATSIEVEDVIISGNLITLLDQTINSLGYRYGINLDLAFSAEDIMVTGNTITKNGFVYWSYGVRITCTGAAETLTDVTISDNKISGVSYGIGVSELAGEGTLGRIYMSSNIIFSIDEDTAATVANATGVYLYTDAAPAGYFFIENNIVDNAAIAPTTAYGVYVNAGYSNVFTGENKAVGTGLMGYSYAAGAGAVTIYLNRLHADVIKVALTANSTFTFVDPYAEKTITFILTQDATGNRTVTWPGTVKWPAATAPTLTAAANAVDVVTLVYDGVPASTLNYYNTSTLLDVR